MLYNRGKSGEWQGVYMVTLCTICSITFCKPKTAQLKIVSVLLKALTTKKKIITIMRETDRDRERKTERERRVIQDVGDMYRRGEKGKKQTNKTKLQSAISPKMSNLTS